MNSKTEITRKTICDLQESINERGKQATQTRHLRNAVSAEAVRADSCGATTARTEWIESATATWFAQLEQLRVTAFICKEAKFLATLLDIDSTLHE